MAFELKYIVYISEKRFNIFRKKTIIKESFMDLEKKEGDDMAIPKALAHEEFSVSGIIQFIILELKVTETLLAGLLNVTSRTLDNWKKKKYPDDLTDKARRIQVLYEFIQISKEKGVKSSELLSLLTESIDENDETSASPIFYIVNDSNRKLFLDFSKLAIKRFVEQN